MSCGENPRSVFIKLLTSLIRSRNADVRTTSSLCQVASIHRLSDSTEKLPESLMDKHLKNGMPGIWIAASSEWFVWWKLCMWYGNQILKCCTNILQKSDGWLIGSVTFRSFFPLAKSTFIQNEYFAQQLLSLRGILIFMLSVRSKVPTPLHF